MINQITTNKNVA